MQRTVRRTLLVLLTVAALVVLMLEATGATASGPAFDTITWQHDTVVVSGIAMVEQTGTVHVTDPSGQDCWYFVLTSTGGTGTTRWYLTRAQRTSGTATDGTWTIRFYLPSTADGVWQITSADNCDAGGSNLPVSGGASFTVTGHHQPRLTWGTQPAVIPAANPDAVIKGRVYDADTGAGMAGVTVGRNEDNLCIYETIYNASPRLDHPTLTNSNGYYSFTVHDIGYQTLQCLGIIGSPRQNPDGFYVYPLLTGRWVHYLPAVSAAPASAVVRHGETDAVNGRVLGGAAPCPIALQRLHGSTAWRTVSTTRVRPSLRFTLTAQPPSAGRFVYRVLYPPCGYGQLTASSSRFVITAT